MVSVDPGYLLPDEVRPVVEGMAAALATTDPVAAAQQFLSASYSTATPAALKSFHMRRIAGVPGPVLVATLGGLFVGEDSLGYRDTSVPYLRRRACPVLAFYTDPDRAAVRGHALRGSTIPIDRVGRLRPLAAPGATGRVQHPRRQLARFALDLVAGENPERRPQCRR